MNERQETESPPAKKQKFEASNESSSADVPENIIDFTEDTEALEEKFTIEDKCNNFVTPEELEKLKEFKVLDEVKSNDGDSDDNDSDSSDGKSEELPEEEIEKMLDENLPDDFKGARKPKEKPYVTRTKTFLEEKGVNQFEILPLDWMMVRHYSGMPIYMHRPTRVCTLSKPYFLGKGNTRRHDIPISAIPCLAYRRALEEEEKQKEIDRRVEEQIKNKTWLNSQTDNALNQNTDTIDKNNTTNQENTDLKIDNSNDDNELSNETSISMGKCPMNHLSKKAAENKDNLQTESTDQGSILLEQTNDKKVNEEATSSEPNLTDKEKEIPIIEAIKEEGVSDESQDNENGKNDGSNDNEADGKVHDEIPLNRQPVVLPDGVVMPSPRVESVNTSWKTQHLTAEQINDYCKRLFKFKTVNFMHFNRWADRRKYTKARKALQYPKLPEGTKLITIPATSTGQENGGKAAKRDWVMNMNGCSYLSEFHEYVCRALQKQPVYEYKQLENASTPYQATVYIGGMQYGVGHGSSKRQAKYAAARASIQTLIPEMRQFLEPAAPHQPAEPDFSTLIPEMRQFLEPAAPHQPAEPDFSVSTALYCTASIQTLIPEMRQFLEPAAPHQPAEPDFSVSTALYCTASIQTLIPEMRQFLEPAAPHQPAEPDFSVSTALYCTASIQTLIPEMRQFLEPAAPHQPAEPDFSFFDYVGIEDPRIAEFCAATCEPSPHAILLTCLLRNFGAGDWHVHTEMKKLEYQKIELTMRVGKHSATVVCKNKKTAKQRASQAILQALHPHVRSWGSLLRLYGSRSVKSCKEKKLEEQQITLLQDKARHNEPNYAVLDKLRHEMRKLRERDDSVVPIGTLLLSEQLPQHSASNLNNVDL